MKIGFEYIKYKRNAKGRHGIHSPFVYDLVDKCLKTRIDNTSKSFLTSFFNKLKKDKQVITIQDFGAGSKRLSNHREVATILKTSSSKGKYGKLLYQLSKHYKFKNILEFGTSLGVGTTYLSLGNPDCKIITIEACENTREVALKNFKSLKNITSVHSTFNDYLSNLTGAQFDLIYIDGHHDGVALLDYLEKLSTFSHDETIFILDDIRWSDSMFDAWNKIINNKDYHVTLDFFRIGIIVPRKHQVKEHFTLKL